MELDNQRQRMLSFISHTEEMNKLRRSLSSPADNERQTGAESVNASAGHDRSNASTLPAPLPRSEYANHAYSIGDNIVGVDFYIACDQGDLADVTAFVQHNTPSRAVLQYGLEHASFGGQAEVARFLLANGASLHSNVFARLEPQKFGNISTFERHPRGPDLPAQDITRALEVAVGSYDMTIVQKLLDHGANPHYATLSLHLLSQNHDPSNPYLARVPVPFSRRKPVAEYLLTVDGVQVDEKRDIPLRFDPQVATNVVFNPAATQSCTPLDAALQNKDWDFAEWLLDHGGARDKLGALDPRTGQPATLASQQ
ncbi:unnamed protein product [Parascedosporium putredinis]|uniref:Ankyrin repeat protein n=1 Tax=Parascedosporium putredinis TaxID=1442378 RepID=A0A9P1ME14_9PEZI|nr:unnamed protein product [Parascedosporium putredinis]CAI8001766.1 unnamed protein product [Parascedosporium putredinis]